jgi:hypothetical protein
MSVIALVLLAAVAAASAATLHVTVSTDGNTPGSGTLRSVIASAVSGDTVVIDPGVEPQLSSQFGGITISASTLSPTPISLTIEGQGARSTTITGDGFDSTFSLLNGCECHPTLTITGVTLTGGGGSGGGALFVSGSTTATLIADTLLANMVNNGDGSGLGGASTMRASSP